MKQKPKASSLAEILALLTNYQGLRQSTLRDDLGSGLRTLCDIAAEDTPEDVLQKASDKFEQAIRRLTGADSFTAEQIQILARVNYNIAPYKESRKKTAGERRKWLGENANQRNWRDSSSAKPIFRVKTGRDKLAEHIVPQLEKILLAEWNKRFPDEPFPVDQPLPNDPELLDPPSPHRSRFWKKPVALACIAAIVLAASVISLTLLNPPTARADCADTARSLDIKQPYGPKDKQSGWGVVFPADRSDRASEFLARADQMRIIPEDGNQFLSEELNAGAYLYRGMRLVIELTGLDERKIVIRDLRPVIHDRAEIPVEALIFLPLQGGDGPTTEVYFDLDDARPAARISYPGKREAEESLLFEVKRIGISRGQTETFVLHFDARYSAFTFNLAVDYEVDGVTCTQIINRSGQPFRVAAAACPASFEADKSRNRNLQPLKDLRYKAIRGAGFDETIRKYVFVSGDPEMYASTCETWFP